MHRDRRAIVVAALAILTVGSAALAGSEQAARELLRVMRVEKSAMSGGDATADAMIRANPVLLPYRDVILEWVHKTMTWEAIEPKVVAVYSETFTDEEMRQAAAFYSSPAGQKFLDKLPELMKKTAAIANDLGAAHQAELKAMIAARAKELAEQTPGH